MQCMQPARAAAALLLAALAASQPYLPDAYSEYQGSAPSRMALSAFSKLKKSPEWVASWPEPLELGQVSAVSVDRAGRVHLFHRGERRWRADTFDFTNHYLGPAAPISQPTVLVLNSTGELLDTWAQDMFFMPHGLTVDSEDNVWLTDVALHQVFKFAPGDRKTPALQLGVRFSPGDDESHFCKPSAVAVLASGEFFVADGYCNTRIIKHSRDGRRILEWGKENPPAQGVPPPYALLVPHALTLAEERGLVCAADRENGRVQCFHASNGTFHSQYHSWLIGGRLFSLVYSPRGGGRLYVVNGPTPSYRTVRGFVIDFDSGRLIQYFGPNGHGLENPHDIAVSPDGQSVYVVELDPHKVHKFVEAIGKNETQQAGGGDKRLQQEQSPAPAGSSAGSGVSEQMRPRAQPAATLEEASVVYTGAAASWGAWLGVAGGAAGGLGAVLICSLAAGVALLRARRTGWLKVRNNRRRWEYAGSEFKLRRLLERPHGFQRVNTEESDEEATPSTTMLPAPAAAHAAHA